MGHPPALRRRFVTKHSRRVEVVRAGLGPLGDAGQAGIDVVGVGREVAGRLGDGGRTAEGVPADLGRRVQAARGAGRRLQVGERAVEAVRQRRLGRVAVGDRPVPAVDRQEARVLRPHDLLRTAERIEAQAVGSRSRRGAGGGEVAAGEDAGRRKVGGDRLAYGVGDPFRAENRVAGGVEEVESLGDPGSGSQRLFPREPAEAVVVEVLPDLRAGVRRRDRAGLRGRGPVGRRRVRTLVADPRLQLAGGRRSDLGDAAERIVGVARRQAGAVARGQDPARGRVPRIAPRRKRRSSRPSR